ncbi:hypothetical protein ACFX15_012922 [Malus domestica]
MATKGTSWMLVTCYEACSKWVIQLCSSEMEDGDNGGGCCRREEENNEKEGEIEKVLEIGGKRYREEGKVGWGSPELRAVSGCATCVFTEKERERDS